MLHLKRNYMKKKYDLLIVTPSNSFYKVNLFNEISKERNLIVLFSGKSVTKRSNDFYSNQMNFTYLFLPKGIVSSFCKLIEVFRSIGCKNIIFSGWDFFPILPILYIFKFHRIGCIVESSINESVINGWKSFFKKIFLKRVDVVLASGTLQEQLVRCLGFEGQVSRFGGCGILNYQKQPKFEYRNEVRKFLYVGRLVPIKNVAMLVDFFNKHPEFRLTVVGTGKDEVKLKKMANSNILFVGSVNNLDIAEYYQQADVFLLPSKSEPWGLVVEEALNNGCPVIVSDKVGCSEDLVKELKSGIIFKSNDFADLENAIIKISDLDTYNNYRENIANFNFGERAKRQVNAFLSFSNE